MAFICACTYRDARTGRGIERQNYIGRKEPANVSSFDLFDILGMFEIREYCSAGLNGEVDNSIEFKYYMLSKHEHRGPYFISHVVGITAKLSNV